MDSRLRENDEGLMEVPSSLQLPGLLLHQPFVKLRVSGLERDDI